MTFRQKRFAMKSEQNQVVALWPPPHPHLTPNLPLQPIQIPHQQTAAVEGDQFFVPEVIQRCCYRLAARGGEVGNFLVGIKLPDDPFVAHPFAFVARGFHQKLHDPAPAVFKHHRFQAAFHF